MLINNKETVSLTSVIKPFPFLIQVSSKMASEELKFYSTVRKSVEADHFFPPPPMENASVTLQMDRRSFPAFLRALQCFSPVEKLN